MGLDTVRARWVEASCLNPPAPRCGHSAVAVDSRECWGQEFLVSRCFPASVSITVPCVLQGMVRACCIPQLRRPAPQRTRTCRRLRSRSG